MPKALIYSLFTSIVLICSFSWAMDKKVQTVNIFSKGGRFKEPGSVYSLGKKNLRLKQSTNAHEVIKEIPGVSIQKEDGLGLRLNIGLRGVQPHRSKKITLLEDGIMIAPAPYSAPAAYYSPLFSRIVDLEVYKGPAALQFGPNSIGGTLNFLTRDFSKKTELNYSFGSFNTHKIGVWNSGGYKNFKWLLELNRLQSKGFKTLFSKDLNFYKNDVLAKFRYDFSKSKVRSLDFKYSYGEEDSNESYLGLTEEDFNQNPFKRYQASEHDKLDWRHHQFVLSYLHQVNASSFLDFKLYRNRFKRTWDKINGFKDSNVDTQDVLINPVGQNADFLKVLKGEKDSAPSETLLAGINRRAYVSQGVQVRFNTKIEKIWESELALLYHEDQIDRTHELRDLYMVSGRTVKDPNSIKDVNNQNDDKAKVFRFYWLNKLNLNSQTFLKYGFRAEKVQLSRRYKLQTKPSNRSETLVTPGIGLSYKLKKQYTAFIGAYKGTTLPAPGQDSSIRPETGVNYELGFRKRGRFQIEMVSFLNDYDNILSNCTFSNGCPNTNLDQQYNGGEALVYGLEFLAAYPLMYKSLRLPLSLSATYTKASFSSDFNSQSKEWGIGLIEKGAPLPYIPSFSVSGSMGLEYKKWSSKLSWHWQSKMWDQAISSSLLIPNFGTLDFFAAYQFNKNLRAYFTANNLLDQKYISSLRPFGYRPGPPRWLSLGVIYSL